MPSRRTGEVSLSCAGARFIGCSALFFCRPQAHGGWHARSLRRGDPCGLHLASGVRACGDGFACEGVLLSSFSFMATAETPPGKYTLSPAADTDGTYRCSTVMLVPKKVVEAFGPGQGCDGYKISKRWVFACDDRVFTLYDWKLTTLYEPDLWSPDEFWQLRKHFELHVGCNAGTSADHTLDSFPFLKQRQPSRGTPDRLISFPSIP